MAPSSFSRDGCTSTVRLICHNVDCSTAALFPSPATTDNRNIPALGRIGDPHDIIASVLVEDSKILPDTYQAMPSYRLCSSAGPTQLTEGLATKLKNVLEDIAPQETP
ncbi:hypothetical protein PAXRUDRAFT_832360 [Paxillus rubicundulus Ve08.2h10]|uniref:Unplaced genomic scaffold scaffold_843, whole genome shotgun sequence n=1 Tax=Paxillus rubicundulus Ve08.2h10 TaxID=930991 RepID=A0A0D0CHK2_9AGAM|nr:hypothetical protein PAXRUDRAFT_832360 [Paxillus rubicundulus Ve08.2h10]